MAHITTVIWDWNGTLLDDVALCARLIDTLLTRHGYAPVGSLERYRQVFRFPVRAYYEDVGFDFSRHPFDELAAEYMELYTPQSEACGLVPGALDTVRRLREKGLRQVILSASRTDILRAQVAARGLDGYMDALVGIGDIYAKSKVDAGLCWLRESGTDASRALLVGDSTHDFETAQALRAQCVLFAGGHQPEKTLAATGAPVIGRLADMEKYL